MTLQFMTEVWQHQTGGIEIIPRPTAAGLAVERKMANFTLHSFTPEIACREQNKRSKKSKKLYFNRQTKTRENVRLQKKKGPGQQQLWSAGTRLVEYWIVIYWLISCLHCIHMISLFSMSFLLSVFPSPLPSCPSAGGAPYVSLSCSRLWTVFLLHVWWSSFGVLVIFLTNANRCYRKKLKLNWIMSIIQTQRFYMTMYIGVILANFLFFYYCISSKDAFCPL